MRKSFALTLALVCAVTLLVGCGKKVVKTEGVTGTITLDGAPLADCNVYFLAVEKGSGTLDSFAKTDASGNYKLQTMTGAANAGTTPGKYKVQAESSNGTHYTYLTCESDNSIMEYYETWKEEDFPETYSIGASLSRLG